MNTPVLSPDHEILTLARLARLLEGARTELTLPQYRLLALLGSGQERASHLAGQLELAKPTVSAAIDTLVERGLVERAAVDGDRRAVRLTITAAGVEAFRVSEELMRARLEKVLALTDGRDLIEQALVQLGDALDLRFAEKWGAVATASSAAKASA